MVDQAVAHVAADDSPAFRRLGYLSGGPRVSTHVDAEAGGPRAHVIGTIGAFERLGWQVERFIVGDRVPQHWRGAGSQKALSGKWSRRLAADLVRVAMGKRNARRAWRELGGKVDLVYERFAAFQMLGRTFQRRGMPWVLETNGLLFYEARHDRKSMVLSGLARRLEIQAYHACDALVCVTQAMKDLAVQETGVSPDKVVLMPNGVDTQTLSPERAQPERLFGDRFTLGYVGVLSHRKGLNVALDAIAEVRRRGLDVCMVIVGDGQKRQEWERQASALGLEPYVKFVGQVPWTQVPNYIAGFDVAFSGQVKLPIGVMYDSPLKLYEYMALARPVIASCFPDAQQAVEHGETGFLFEPGDAKALADALYQAVERRESLQAMGQRARELAIQRYDWQARVSRMLEEVKEKLPHAHAAR